MIDNLLNNYRKNNASIEMLRIKISQWQDTLKKDAEEIDLICSKPKSEKVGSRPSGVSNPIESLIIRVEEHKNKLNKWIDDAKIKIEKYQKENKIVDILLESLDEESHFIITQKYFERKKWNIITYQFNRKYRDEYHEYITSSGVRKKFEAIKKELSAILCDILPK